MIPSILRGGFFILHLLKGYNAAGLFNSNLFYSDNSNSLFISHTYSRIINKQDKDIYWVKIIKTRRRLAGIQ